MFTLFTKWLSTITLASTVGLALAACSSAPEDAKGDDHASAETSEALTPVKTPAASNCYHQQDLRAVYPLTTCPNEDKSGALCYPACRAGYHGIADYCWRDASIISANNNNCPWYDKCGLTFAKGCSICPPGYDNDGCTCRINVDSYFRGWGDAMSCAPGQQEIGALCYGACPAGWNADGIYCNKVAATCPAPVPITPLCPNGGGQTYAYCLENPDENIPHQCGDMIESDQFACTEAAAKAAAQRTATNWKLTDGACPACSFPIQ